MVKMPIFFLSFFIDVVIKFNAASLNEAIKKQPEKSKRDLTNKSKKIRKEILALLRENNKASRKEISSYLHISEGSVRHHMNCLIEEGIIKHHGPDKGGYWEIKE